MRTQLPPPRPTKDCDPGVTISSGIEGIVPGVMLALLVLTACATFVARESDVRRKTRETKARCEAAAKAGQDTTTVCHAHLKP